MEAESTQVPPARSGYDLTPRLRADGEAMAVLIMTAVLLTLINYFGLARHFAGWFPWVKAPATLFGLYGLLWWAGFSSAAYFAVPAIWLKMKGRSLRDYGFRLPRPDRMLWIYPGMFAIMLGPLWLASKSPAFLHTYPFYPYAAAAPGLWLCFEAAYAVQFVALEFFFRGFLIFSLRRSFGEAAVLVSMVPYCMIHFQKPFPECMGAIVAGLVLGFLSMRTGSIAGGVAVHWSVAITMDLLAIWRKGGFMPGVPWFG